jgi:hypothetical protein
MRRLRTAFTLGWGGSRAAGAITGAALVGLVLASPALAAGPPHMGPGDSAVSYAEPTQTSVHSFHNDIEPHGLATTWHYDYAPAEGGHPPAEASPSWAPVPGGSGTTPATSVSLYLIETNALTGLTPETAYYVRLQAENEDGSLILEDGAQAPLITRFETQPLRPRSACCQVTSVGGTSAHLRGQVVPDNFETHWRFEYSTSQSALEKGEGTLGPDGVIATAEADEAFHQIDGLLTGLEGEHVYYVRLFAENEHGDATLSASNVQRIETGGKPNAGTFAVHSIHGDVLRALGSVLPHGFDTQFHVEYVTQERFDESGWETAESGPELDAGAGEYSETIHAFPTLLVGEDLPGLRAGAMYRYRLVASSVEGVARGEEQTLSVPVPAPAEEPACPNAHLRIGPSARLPDCRAYELVTPADKGGAMDIDTYGGAQEEPHIGEDGQHFTLYAPGTQWGPSPDAKLSTYFFSRSPDGWQMSSLTPQPEAGANTYLPSIFSADLTQVGLEAGWKTSQVSKSPELEFKTGPTGGPYATVAAVPRAEPSGWVGASPDAGKLIFQTAAYTLGGQSSGTTSGYDLYEYSEDELRQLNMLTSGERLGRCGAKLVRGSEGYQQTEIQEDAESSSPHAVSSDGSRVFFEAVPGDECSSPKHLYMRVNGGSASAETIDIGPYVFLAANAQGTELLLEKRSGETHEFLSYDVESAAAAPLFSTVQPIQRPIASADLSALYFRSTERLTAEAPPIFEHSSEHLGNSPLDVYRYDIPTKALRYIAQAGDTGGLGGGYSASPDGRYYYFTSSGLAGVPGGGGALGESESNQVYRYDNTEGFVQCMSCASPFDPEPKLRAYFLFGRETHTNAVPNMTISSANGDYVFFDTTAALVPQDADGEIAPSGQVIPGNEHVEFVRSASSDTYEWRRNGVDGCARIEGCVSLISGGAGGYKTELLGTTPSGSDVFFATHESLVSQDGDTAGDVYDARIGGGYPPPPPRPVECEGDACESPLAAPVDDTPASLTFSAPGNLTQPLTAPIATAKPKPKLKPCRKGTARRKGRCVRKKRARRPGHKGAAIGRRGGHR